MSSRRRKIPIDGNEAAASVAYRTHEVYMHILQSWRGLAGRI